MDSRPVRLLDREEIRELMLRYARGVDRADWDLVRSVYHADGYDDHGSYRGDVDGFIDFLEARSRPLPQSMHFLGNCFIEFASDELAAAETYFMTAHTLTPREGQAGEGGPPSQLSSYGRYVDRVERRGGPWLIAHRVCVIETQRIHSGNSPPVKPDWARHSRAGDDPIVRLREALGLAPDGTPVT